MQAKEIIKQAVKEAINASGLKWTENLIKLEKSVLEQHGDYSLPLFGLAKNNTKSPLEISEVLVKSAKSDFFKADFLYPGYLNFTLSDQFLQNYLNYILQENDKFGSNSIGGGKKAQVEFISANPTGPITLGNGRGAFYGDVLANVLEFSGYDVEREFYINDAKHSGQIRALGLAAQGKSEEYQKALHYIEDKINFGELNKIDEEEAGFKIARDIQEKNKSFIEEKLKIKFDKWFSEENNLYETGEVEAAQNLLQARGLTEEKEGAFWLKSSEFGDDEDRVLVRSNGEPTYFLTDIAYHLNKFKRGFDTVIDFWGADHHGHKKRMFLALKALGEYPKRIEVIIMQLVRLIEKGKEKKMSKRKGDFITLEELIDEVGLDAARFFFLFSSPNKHLNFDLDLVKKQSSENPVYYVQYAFARISSILAKSGITKDEAAKFNSNNFSLLVSPSELSLIRKMIYFPELIESIVRDYGVFALPHYTIDLARSFHHFYHSDKVLTDDKEITEARLALIQGAGIVFKNCFKLMGIEAKEKM